MIKRLGQPVGERPAVQFPVAVTVEPFGALGLVPAAVDDEIPDPCARDPVDDRPKALRRRRTPGGAVLVEDDGQILLDRGYIQEELVVSRQPVGGVVHAALRDRQVRDGGTEFLSGSHALRPVAQLAVCQPARQVEGGVRAAQLDLPRGRVGNLRAPADAGAAVLDERRREEPVHRPGSDLAEAKAPTPAGPGPLEAQVLDVVGDQAPLGRPGAAQPVQDQIAGGVAFGEGCQTGERERREQLQRHRDRSLVAKDDK